MAFDPCPSSLIANRVASFKFRGETGAWSDTSGTYTLSNNNTVQTQRASSGKAFVGPAALCSHEAFESFEASHADLIRNGADWTKVGVLYHALSNFDSTADRVTVFIADQSLNIVWSVNTNATPTKFSQVYFNGVFSSNARAWDYTSPVLAVVKNDHGTNTVFQFYRLSDGTKLQEVTKAGTLAARTSEFYGRGANYSATVNNGSRTVIDGIQVFDAVLSDADCQSICEHWRTQQQFVNNWIKASEVSA